MARKKSSVVEQVVGPWRNRIIGYGEEDPEQLLANDRNWRIHTHDQEKSLSAVLNKVGIVQSILVNKRSGKVVDGHLRAAMAISEGQSRVPVVYVELSDEEEALILATFDRITAMAGIDREKLDELVSEVAEDFPDLADILCGIDEYIGHGPGSAAAQQPNEDSSTSLAERFGVPPFSVLDARQGYWQERKHAWLSLGIQSELGRGGLNPSNPHPLTADSLGASRPARIGGASPGGSPRPACDYSKRERGDGRGRAIANA